MDAREFLNDFIRPVLGEIELWSPEAEKLLLMTAIHESGGFKHERQIHGPALSYYQIEPETWNDLYKNYLSFRPSVRQTIDKILVDGFGKEEPDYPLMNRRYATAVCRMLYYRSPGKLPPVSDELGMAKYWKEHYNTHLGKGTVVKFLNDWKIHGQGLL